MRETTCGQYSICTDTIIPGTERRVAPNQYFTGILDLRQERERFAYLHLHVFRGILVDKINSCAHICRQHNPTSTL